jgi:ketosteroid isomerase-like protein
MGEIMRVAIALLFVLCATVLMVSMAPSPDAEIQTRIIALEKAWNLAYKFADTHALDSLLDDQIVLINDDGSTQTKSQFLASIKRPAQEQQVSPESISVRVYGTVAIASGVFRAKGLENGKRYVRHERFVDTWFLKGGRWVCIATNATPILH